MDKRSRVLAALGHRQPDKTPVSIGATIVDGFTVYAKSAYETHLGKAGTPDTITHIAMKSVETPCWLMDGLGMEFATVRMKGPFLDRTVFEPDGSYNDEYGVYWKKCELYNDPVRGPLYGPITEGDILTKARWPDAYDKGRVKGLRGEALAIRERGDKIVVADLMCGGPFEQALWMRGWQDFLCDLHADPMLAEALLDRITESAMALWDAMLNEIGDIADIVCQGDDLGMQDRCIVSPGLYNRHIRKYHERLFRFIKSRTGAKLFLHSCGSVYELIPGFIDMGVDILNPVQITAKNMQPERLKKEFGPDIVFWGAIDTQKILPYGTLQEIRGHVRHLVETLGRDGGYILAPGHNIQGYISPDRIDTMVEAMIEYR